MYTRRLSFVILVLLITGCVEYVKYIPDPEKDVEKWIVNFSQQRSFSYHYRLKAASVFTEAKGDCIIGQGEHIKGRWFSSDSEMAFEYIGLRDIEYQKSDRKWVKSARGEESDIFSQIQRLFKFDKFYYMGGEEDYVYHFWANIPFLAPGRWKEMVGILKVSKKNYLPSVIWTGLPDSSVYLEVELYNYNKKKTVKSPVECWYDYLLVVSPDKKKEIARRLKLIGVKHRLKKKGDALLLSLPEYYTLDDVKSILSTRSLNVYTVVEQKEEAQRIGYLKDDRKNALYLGEKLFSQDDIKGVKIKFDGASKPYFEITLKTKSYFPEKVAFELDGIIQYTATLDINRKINKMRLYTDMSFYEMQNIRASFLQPLPLIGVKPSKEELN